MQGFSTSSLSISCRTRTTATPGKPVKKTKVEGGSSSGVGAGSGSIAGEEEDLTRDMEDPTPEPAVTEVSAGSKVQPSKGGNYMDLDEEGTEKSDKIEGPVSVIISLFQFLVL